MTNWLSTLTGVALLVLVFYDVYSTVLRATKRPGPLSGLLNRNLWWAAITLTRRMNRWWRHRILTSIGPLLMPLLITLLILMLITGFALLYLPRMEGGFKISEETGANPFLQAFYFSGVTLMTIGYGEILPQSGAMRLLALVEGAAGVSVFSLAITYLLTVYGALERKRAVALNFYHQARQGADVSGLITRHFARNRFYNLTEELRQATRDLHELLESHIEHPVIHYFHPVEVYKGLPRALFVVLETVAILNSQLDEQEYVEAGDHPDVLTAEESALYVLAELVTSLDLEKLATRDFESENAVYRRRSTSFNRALKRLRQAGIKTRTDVEAAFAEYNASREAWERQLFCFADFLGYDWDEVTGDRDLADATDEEVIERHERVDATTAKSNSI